MLTSRSRRVVVVVLLTLLLCLALLAAVASAQEPEAQPTVAQIEHGPRAGLRSIAVSKFANLGVDPAHSHFCSGLTDEVIGGLTKTSLFRVMPRITSAGEEARADYMLEGSVRNQGYRLRISVQLIDTANNLYVWSETWERDLLDVFAVQDEISRSVVAAIRREFAAR